MIDEFRGGAAFGAERLAGRMCGIGFEAGEAAVFHDCDCTAPGDAQPAIAVNALQAGVISHRIFSRSSKACSIRPSSSMSESAFAQPTRKRASGGMPGLNSTNIASCEAIARLDITLGWPRQTVRAVRISAPSRPG